MKKSLFRILVLCLAVTLSSQTAIASTELNPFSSFDPASVESPQKEIERLQLNPQQLQLPTEQLVTMVGNYPYLINIFLSTTYEQGFNHLSDTFNGIAELRTRADAENYIKQYIEKYRSSKNEKIKKAVTFYEIMLAQKDFLKIEEINTVQSFGAAIQDYSPSFYDRAVNERITLESMFSRTLNSLTSLDSLSSISYSTVYTPKGSPVSVMTITPDLTLEQKTWLNNQVKADYPKALYQSTSTENYNCHSYAWYYSSTSNTKWMNVPSKYMTDGSYARSSAVRNNKIYYYDGDHSGNIIAVGLENPGEITVISKWGKGPLMVHTAWYSPYTGGANYWKKQ